MTVLHAGVPIFLALIGLEWLVARRGGRRVYALRDSMTDVGCGILSQICGVYLALLSLALYQSVAEHAALQRHPSVPTWPEGGPLSSVEAAAAWTVVFLLVDLGQYWMHRASHRVSLLWACHLVHHSSEELNYAVALRNSSLHGLFLWMVPLPLAVAGVPWQAFAVCYGLNVAYQFWLHTRVIGRLGWLESVLNTPSHHRVHHGRDPEYVDRNFGGVLIVWDRLFGTFAREGREPEYGVHPRIAGSDPVWANLWGFTAIAREMRRSPGLASKAAAIFGPPRWSEGPITPPPHGGTDAAGPLPSAYALAQFLVLLAATVVLLGDLGRAPLGDVAVYGVLAALTLTGVSAVLDAKPWALRFELLRLAAVVLAVLAPGPQGTGLVPAPILLGYAAISLAPVLMLIADASRRRLVPAEG